MITIGILAVGLIIVIGGILGFRLHAFVALVLAGLAVALLTPADVVNRSAQLEGMVRSAVIDADSMLVLAARPIKDATEAVLAADSEESGALIKVGQLTATRPVADWAGEIPFPANDEGESKISCYRFEFLPDAALGSRTSTSLRVIPGTAFSAAAALGKQSFMSRLTSALGSYCGSLAILIVAASIIGRCLMDSGAADRIVTSTLNVVGEKNAPAAFVISGFTLSIPVFFDTVFYLMIPLGKALRLRTGGNYLLYVMAIVAGGTMAHSLVPPTPGPLFIAEAFDVSLAAMIVGGCIVGLFSSSVGMLYAVWANRHFELKLPEEQAVEGDDSPANAIPHASDQAPENSNQPSLIASLIPIILPVLMITAGALVQEHKADLPGIDSTWSLAGIAVSKTVASAFTVMGEKTVALLVAAIFAVFMYVRTKKPSRETFAAALQDAVSSAGTIILVTAAGGAFGRMMRQANVAELLQGLPSTSPVMVIIAAFLVTVAVRTAQGSSTVAMMTAAGIFGGLVTGGAAGVDPLYVALAVGCGSKPIAWMNDSGFWVITRMSGMSEKEGLKYITPMTALAGLAGLGAVILGVIFFP